MLKKVNSLKKNLIATFLSHFTSAALFYLVILLLLFSFIFLCFNHEISVIAESSPYTPAPPSGNTTGYINVNHEYVVYTIDVGSCWMFDWGDGYFSDWMEVGIDDNFISQTYSWESYGIYEVRVKHRSIYMMESEWSPPLIVTIPITPDFDGDGYINEVEETYGKNPEDPNEYPLDTDEDGIPDDDSADGNYTGDSDDDNDGLLDTFEKSVGSDPKDSNDVITLIIKETFYYLVDVNGDGNSDVLYNSENGRQTKVSIENGVILLDITGDGSWDYSYDGTLKSYYHFPWLYVAIGVILAIIIIIYVLFKKGILFIYQEEYEVED